MATIRVEHSKNYTCISNAAIRDKTLSLKARGLHHLLLSFPDGWTINTDSLTAESDKDGRDAFASGLKELENAGYIERKRIRDEGTGRLGWESIIRELPITGKSGHGEKSSKTRKSTKASGKATDGKATDGKATDGKATDGKATDGKAVPILSTDLESTDLESTDLESTVLEKRARSGFSETSKEYTHENPIAILEESEPPIAASPESTSVLEGELLEAEVVSTGAEIVPLFSHYEKTNSFAVFLDLRPDPSSYDYRNLHPTIKEELRLNPLRFYPWNKDTTTLSLFFEFLANSMSSKLPEDERRSIAETWLRKANQCVPLNTKADYSNVLIKWGNFLRNASQSTTPEQVTRKKSKMTPELEAMFARRRAAAQ